MAEDREKKKRAQDIESVREFCADIKAKVSDDIVHLDERGKREDGFNGPDVQFCFREESNPEELIIRAELTDYTGKK